MTIEISVACKITVAQCSRLTGFAFAGYAGQLTLAAANT